MSRLRLHTESHLVSRIGWLRAAVLGANDGIISTASLIVGVAAAAGSPEDSQPGAEGTGRPRGGARDVDCDWWGCTDGGVSTPARTNPGHADNGGSIALGGSVGPGAVTDPTRWTTRPGRAAGAITIPHRERIRVIRMLPARRRPTSHWLIGRNRVQ
jgi:hypothetical protein